MTKKLALTLLFLAFFGTLYLDKAVYTEEVLAKEPVIQDDSYICSRLTDFKNGGDEKVREYCINLARQGL